MKRSTGKYSDADDMTLVKASVDGDKTAFGEIVNRYKSMVARTVKGMLGDTVFAEDLGQEVFIKLYDSLPGFRGEAKLSTYIQKIAINITLNEIKRRKRFFSMFSRSDDDEIHEYDVTDTNDEERKDAREIVNKALQQLEPKFRVVVAMRMLQGYSTKETAEILDLPVGTVLSRLARGQEQMKKILKRL
ncbi:MAG TPA: RNA polymerase sigma factor [Bacteroidales bacterium]|nr:RNA polymerase sigma factor [Bacteroidales bacterium]HCI55206.1 RNA polymerase subunit sigma-24 [Bacteroidales bacterium]HOU95599.1 RNA polymerase sigma factor [Bacteroidales bacterium]HQG36626.1 RNA polymerase sigma factor [Bacteroidales bacterium]HQG53202.1 RNA polymerase sigma factor [Bacteroidales bacterium]